MSEAKERKNPEDLEAQLRQAKERLHLAMNVGNHGFWEWDIKTNALFLSEKWKKMLGYKDEELDNQFKTFETLIHPNDKPYVFQEVKAYLNGERDKYEVEFRMKHKSGRDVWILANGDALRDETGTAYKMAGIHYDITDRKEREEITEALSESINNTDNLVVVKDTDLKIVAANRALVETLGYRSVNEIIGMTDEELFGISRQQEPVRTYMEDELKAQRLPAGDFIQKEEPLRNHKGQKRVILTKKYPIYDKRKKLIGTGTISVDITQRKQIERELIDAKKKAEKANMAKNEFLANMSHEIRTPMNGVIGFSELLKRTELQAIQKKYLDNIISSGKNLLAIINDILDFSKIEAGKMKMNLEKTDIRNMIEQCVKIIEPTVLQKDLQIREEIDERVPEFVITDPLRFNQVISNLLSNAVKFTHEGEIGVKARLIERKGTTARIEFAVTDTGIGISEKKQHDILNSFTQEDSTITRKYGGTGLGLTISNSILKIMGSELNLDSEKGKGSTFSFVLSMATKPQKEETPMVHDKEKGTERMERETEQVVGTHKILIVEDDQVNFMLAKTIIKREFPKTEVFEAKDGQAGVEKYHSLAPDLIFMDVRMPQMDGMEATKLIREAEKGTAHVPIIALTADVRKERLERCLEVGMDSYITKPVKPEDIADKIREYLGE